MATSLCVWLAFANALISAPPAPKKLVVNGDELTLRVDRKYIRNLVEAKQLGVQGKVDLGPFAPRSGASVIVFQIDVRAPAAPQRTFLPERIMVVTDGKGFPFEFELNVAPDPANAVPAPGAAFRAAIASPLDFDHTGVKLEGAVWAVDRTVMEFAFERDALKEGGVAKWNDRRALIAAISEEDGFKVEIHIPGRIDGLGREAAREPFKSRLRQAKPDDPARKKKEPYVIGKVGEASWDIRDAKGKSIATNSQGGGFRSRDDEVRHSFSVGAADKSKVDKLVLRVPILQNPKRVPFAFAGVDLPPPSPAKKGKRVK
ncbi:MAG TPA: hypothetical protein VNC50_17695 [Planctomycetia bacterium]|nr:hypothetical protein [Planctomycetia bacterium]